VHRFTICPFELAGDLLHEPLHPQQRRKMRFIEDAARHGQQILESLAAQQRLGGKTGPRDKCFVDVDDGAVWQGRNDTARQMSQ